MGKKKLSWKTEQRRVGDLINYEFNPRTMTKLEASRLDESISKFNLVEIPAINTDNVIIAGHQRVAILIRQNREEEIIDVRVPNRVLSDEELKEYNIRSNKNTGKWDYDILANHFEESQLLDFGFTQVEFGKVTPEERPVKENRFSLGHEILFETEDQRNTFKKFLKGLAKKYPDLKTDAARITKFINENS